MEVYAFLYTDCIHESSFATMSLHRTKAGAYKAMRKFLILGYTQWYHERILYGKDRLWIDKFGNHCAWRIGKMELKD